MSERKYKVGDAMIKPVDEDGTLKHEMTKEEAIAYFKKKAIRIKGIMAWEEDDAFKDKLSQSLEANEMAIKALRQMPEHTKCDRCPYGETKVVNVCNYDGQGCGWD